MLTILIAFSPCIIVMRGLRPKESDRLQLGARLRRDISEAFVDIGYIYQDEAMFLVSLGLCLVFRGPYSSDML